MSKSQENTEKQSNSLGIETGRRKQKKNNLLKCNQNDRRKNK